MFLTLFALNSFMPVALAGPFDSKSGWRSEVVYGKYIPEGPGWRVVGELTRVVDIDTNEVMGYHHYRNFRSIWILVNKGQPYLESWDFPENCPLAGCSDSRMARVTLIPYKSDNFLGKIEIELREEDRSLKAMVNQETLIEFDTETMNPIAGLLREDLNIPPKELLDPAIFCSSGITCLRALAFGRLPHQDLRAHMYTDVNWADGAKEKILNKLLYSPYQESRPLDPTFLYPTEELLYERFRKTR